MSQLNNGNALKYIKFIGFSCIAGGFFDGLSLNPVKDGCCAVG